MFGNPIHSGKRSLSMESNDLTIVLTLEAGQIPYLLHGFALGSVQLRIFFFQSVCPWQCLPSMV